MEENPFQLSVNMQKIIDAYKKIHKAIFVYGMAFCVFVLGSVVAYKQMQRTDLKIYEEREEFLINKVTLKKSFEKFIEQQVQSEDIAIEILQGSLQSTGEFLQSNNNLLTYKGYVVPRFFFLYSTVPLQPMESLTGNYDISALENFAQNVVFTPIVVDEVPFKRGQIPLFEDVENSFNISCIYQPKFLQ